MDRTVYEKILALLHQEVKPALGCTEPIAVALAAACAAEQFNGKEISCIEVRVSPNILKNAMGVGIPGTDETGLYIATALATVCGRSEYGLEVLKDLTPSDVEKARAMVEKRIVNVSIADTPKLLYAEVECTFADGHRSLAAVAGAHDKIVRVERDGVRTGGTSQDADVNGNSDGGACSEIDGTFLSLSLINEFASTADISDLELIREEIAMNTRLAEAGLSNEYGLRVGRTIASRSHREVFGDDYISDAMALTAAASDARMAGCPLPAMSNSGSGNQGLTVSLPVIAAARHLGSSEENLIRALAVSNLVAIHIKSYLGKLSALCGCVVASTGSSCGIIYLKGGSIEQMGAAVKNMIGSITGMVCDGAKEGCAMKVASGVSCAVQSAILALEGISVKPTDGIIDCDVEQTIRNLGVLGSKGMLETDRMILGIMTGKE